MNRFKTAVSTVVLLVAGFSVAGCEAGGVGDPCIPEDEYLDTFAGYGVDEVNVEAMSFQCETRLCLVNHFQGRVSCPYGQTKVKNADDTLQDWPEGDPNGMRCKLPDASKKLVIPEVLPQLHMRQTKQAVYCSCRCDGPDKNARYCECPSGYSCTLLNDIPLGADQLLGSYCVRKGTKYSKGAVETFDVCKDDLCPYEGASSKSVNPF